MDCMKKTCNLFLNLFLTMIESFQNKLIWIILLENIPSSLCHFIAAFSLCLLYDVDNSTLSTRCSTPHPIGKL